MIYADHRKALENDDKQLTLLRFTTLARIVERHCLIALILHPMHLFASGWESSALDHQQNSDMGHILEFNPRRTVHQ
jgi:hypothetical protein